MKIISLKPGHDGSIAFLNNGHLVFCLEGEKNSFDRNHTLTPNLVLDAMSYLENIPDVLAIGGWIKGPYAEVMISDRDAEYYGIDPKNIISNKSTFFGENIARFSSSHERSHVMCSYGMSHFEQGQPCYVLIWEGRLGDFYKIDKDLNITHIGKVLTQPGVRYSCAYWVANNFSGEGLRLSTAGKLMALTSFSDHSFPNDEEMKIIKFIADYQGEVWRLTRKDFEWSPFLNSGVESHIFKNMSGKFSDYIFNIFYEYAKNNLTEKLPLLISGGCGLNCDWNTKWKNCGLFSDVFVPPCSNDSGSAIGTAVDAQFYYSGNAKINWNVYAGEEFIEDVDCRDKFEIYDLNYHQVADFIKSDRVIAWIQGKYEIGPRALGNRSLLAAPFNEQMRDRLNQIKQRESYRPIAPVCLEEDVSKYFDWSDPSPYMLYFQKLKTGKLKAITHVDNTARVQTVNSSQNEKLHKLLMEFKVLTGFGVLCNTSLNFPGAGFINEMSDLIRYCQLRGIDGFVVNDKFYLPKNL
ncbi:MULTISPECIES: carbamoyltransferase C-terminal domain-containing protein [unclassified Nostoc]|uniref:carbamoyltransferase C-terminal domain-containing protein n=1 Tax=unclassified Nostoc TaxID=2593658 RepID=UPI0026065DD2|nr:carbamoyltransferase C-terminal domain-containing protein [Nostoc sp. S13]MDF5736630.1 carbamoyltransferase C-terminal domain-containing protein [Nostoc sp. S13]